MMLRGNREKSINFSHMITSPRRFASNESSAVLHFSLLLPFNLTSPKCKMITMGKGERKEFQIINTANLLTFETNTNKRHVTS
jgi:hypothetical protein